MNLKNIVNGRTGELLTAAAKDVVRGVAPNLGRALDSPLGQVATREIARQVLGNPDAPPAEISARLERLDPQDMPALTEAQAQVMQAAQAANVDLARIGAQDRADARQRQAETGDATPKRLVYIDTAMLAGLVVLLIFFTPEGDFVENALLVLLGYLTKQAAQGRDFFLGSSTGSKQKTGLLAGKGPEA